MKLVLYGYGVQEVSAMHCVFDAIGLVYFPAFLAAGADRCEKTKRIKHRPESSLVLLDHSLQCC